MNTITIEELRIANNNFGDNYFDPITLKFYKSKIIEVYGITGQFAYFIESLCMFNKETYKIRKFTYISDNAGKVESVAVGSYKSLDKALKQLKTICTI